jgi:hypothetical protein
MDPYLEGSLWISVHAPLAVEIVRQLNPRIRPRYMALTIRRLILDVPEDTDVAIEGIYPDVAVMRSDSPELGLPAVGTGTPALKLMTLMPESVPHISVEIREVKGRQLVTVIEILSPSNKRGAGRDEYLAKRGKILLSDVHLLEIDLLRRGRRVPMKDPMPRAPYFVILSRAGQRPVSEVWPIALDQALPTVPVPLLAGDPDVPLDLQQALASVYDANSLDLAIDYTRPPDVPLPSKAAAWADKLLQAAGLRSGG